MIVKVIKNFSLIVCTFLGHFAFAQNSFHIQFQNQNLIKEFNQIVESKFKTSIEIDSVISLLETFLFERGFLDCEIAYDSLLIDSIRSYSIKVREGKKNIIENIKLVGEDLSKDDLSRINSLFKKSILNQKNINEISIQVVDLLEKKGFPFAEAKFLSFVILSEKNDEKYVEAIFKVTKNEEARISKIEITGNRYTNRDVIIREMRISDNDVFTPELTKKILIRLNRLNIFQSVNTPEFYFDENKNGILEIKVREGKTNLFDGIVGYVPSTNPNEKGYLTGQVNVSLRNLFGTLRAFSFRWNRLNRFSQDLEVKYFEPWFLGFPLNIQTTFNQLKQDTTYIQRTFTGNLEFSFSENLGIILNLTTGVVIPQINYYVVSLNRSSSLVYGLGVIYNSQDHPIYTKSGIFFRTDFNQVLKKDYLLGETKVYYQQKANFSFSIHQVVFKSQLIYFSLNAKVINGGGISISDLFRFGGMKSLRGYEENQFFGNKIFWSNLEYRFLTGYTDYIAAFFDYGYYFRNILSEKTSKFKYGYGVGVGLQTVLGLLKINFALGQGDTFSRGKIHFGIESGF